MNSVYLTLIITAEDYDVGAELVEACTVMPFLLAAQDEEEANDMSDALAEDMETVFSKFGTPEADIARDNILMLASQICAICDEDVIELILDCLRDHNPDFQETIENTPGGVFTVEVTEEAGFPVHSVRVLNSIMAKHHVLKSLSFNFDL